MHVHEVTLFGEACACKSVVNVDCRLVVHCVNTFNFLGDEGVSMDECLQFGAEGGFLPRADGVLPSPANVEVEGINTDTEG